MRILIVEDEEKLARFIERGLVAERFAVDVADDGVSGLELAQTYNYDLMILDLLLRRGPVTRSSVLRVGDLELDRLSQQVKRSGKRIELTSKEYALLEYLMAHTGQVLSRTMIIEHVWDQSFDGVTNIVDVYVRHLRNKVDDARHRKLSWTF